MEGVIIEEELNGFIEEFYVRKKIKKLELIV